MKYIVDIDALKDCLDLLPISYSDVGCVELSMVKRMIDKFPKDELVEVIGNKFNNTELMEK